MSISCKATLTFFALACSAVQAVTFDCAYVGNAGNAADPETGLGAVAYAYRISKHEVTNAQYAEFLNAVDPAGGNALGLYNRTLGNHGGIRNDGLVDGMRYSPLKGRGQRPVTQVSFFDAMRFVNWLHNGQGSGDTESGVYSVESGINEVRSPGAKYWIPSEDEWYKAAYHDASAGMAGMYFDYATGSDTIPISDQPWSDPTAVNYFNNDGIANGFNDGFAVSGLRYPHDSIRFTDVGAYSAAASPYGTFDQSGNVGEWNETIVSYAGRTGRGMRGGRWDSTSHELRAARRGWTAITHDNIGFGFRVATRIPEPATSTLVAIASLAILRRTRICAAAQSPLIQD